MVSHRILSDSKSSQVSRTLLSILADVTNAVVLMVSSGSLVSKSSRPFTNPFVTVSSAPITIGITVTFMFHIFFQFPIKGRGTYLSFRFLSILLCGQSGQQSPQFGKSSFFFVDYYTVWSSGSD